MKLSDVDLLFWTAGLFGHLLLLVVLCVRRRPAVFPFFTALIASNVIRTIVLYFTLHHASRHAYFVVYWSLAVLDSLLQLCVVAELAYRIFRPLGTWASDIPSVSLWTVAGSVLLASALTWFSTPAASTSIQLLTVKGSFFSAALISGLFAGLALVSLHSGLPWKAHVARISLGLGIYSMLDLSLEAAHACFGFAYTSRFDDFLSYARMTAYLACLGYWVVTLWQDEPVGEALPLPMRRQLQRLQQETAYELKLVQGWRKR